MEAFQDQSQLFPATTIPMGAAVPLNREAVSPESREGASKATISTSSPPIRALPEDLVKNSVTPGSSPPKKHRLSPYLNPFASRSSAKLAAPENANTKSSNAETATANNSEGPRLNNSTSEEVVSKPGRKLSKRQNGVDVSHTTVLVKNILSGDFLSPSSVSLGPKVRANKLASSQTKIAPQLLREDKANKVIAEIRQLSPLVQSEHPTVLTSSSSTQLSSVALHASSRPPAVHGVCLEETDEEAETNVFSKLASTVSLTSLPPSPFTPVPKTTISASMNTLADVLGQLKLVNFLQLDPANAAAAPKTLVESKPQNSTEAEPFSQPKDLKDVGKDVTLMGALPSPAVVADGVNNMATQLIALGLGDPKSMLAPTAPDLNELLPDHSGLHPPTDRMSVITCEFNISVETRLEYYVHKNVHSRLVQYRSLIHYHGP